MKFIIIIIFALLLVSLNCKGNPTITLDTSTIYPLKLGNSWTISMTWFHRDGSFSCSDTITNTLTRDSIINNIQVFGFENDDSTTSWSCNKTDGYYSIYDVNNFENNIITFKYPGKAGEYFKSLLNNHPLADSTIKDSILIESTNTIYQTKAGTFNCYKYVIEWPKRNDFRTLYVAPGIGIVSDEIFRNNKFTFKLELISFSLGKKIN